MRRQVAALVCSAILASMAAFSLAVVQAASNNSANGARVQTTIRDLMESIVDPSADVIWNASGTIVDKDQGTVDLFPKTEEAWLDVRRAAVRVIEGANLLMTPGRMSAPLGARSRT